MKIAISATGPGLDAEVDPRFGRCQYFLIVDTDTLAFEAVANQAAMAGGGAGIQAAEIVASKGVEAVLTGQCGPNAFQVLSASGIKVFGGCAGRVGDVIDRYKKGQLAAVSEATVPQHFGMGRGMGMGKGGGGRRGGGGGRGMGVWGGV